MTSKTVKKTTAQDNEKELLHLCDIQKDKELSDNELVLLVRNGQSELFAQIVNRYQKKLHAYFSRVERNREDVENLVQDVFLKVMQNLNKYDANRRFGSWIFSIAHNVAINHVKHASLKKFVSLENMGTSENKKEFPSMEENSDALFIRREVNDEVKNAIKKLPSKYRQVLVLRYYSDKSYEEISKILGKSMNTVGTLIRRAKNKMLGQVNEASGPMSVLEVRYW